MEALTASSLKLVLENHRDKERGFCFPSPKAAAFRVSGPHKYVNPSFSFSVTLRRKTIQPPACSASARPSSQSRTCLENEEIQTNDLSLSQSNTVRVRFQLQRECLFGQQFLIVGDDPMFGAWDPSNAVPLDWSEGHIWTTELDIPCDKTIKYKLILKGGVNTITWQPGPDRMLQTWETRSTIVVCEDWENAELQMLVEEDPTSHQLMQSIICSQLPVHSDNLPQPGDESESDLDDDIILEYANGVPVLVPGMTPIADNEEASHRSNEVHNSSMPKEHCSYESANCEEGTAMLLNGQTDQHDKGHVEIPKLVEHHDQLNIEETENDILDNDIQWGRRTFQQFLMTLGFF